VRLDLRDLTGWVTSFGEVLAVGVEGTASWGAGLCRHLRARGLNVIEVNDQPDREEPSDHDFHPDQIATLVPKLGGDPDLPLFGAHDLRD
jgi:hypothetical protein